MPASHYLCLKHNIETEYEVKKSRFIARLNKVESREQAMDVLTQARNDYPDARHHCWAYIIGNPHNPKLVAMSDDGEPSGTAGKPILNVMQHKPISDVMIVVIRYFGGIKLGAGGLVRAYSQAAQQAYDEAEFEEHIIKQSLTIRCPFQLEQNLRHWLSQHQGEVVTNEYGEQVQLQALLPLEHLAALKTYCLGMESCEVQKVEDN